MIARIVANDWRLLRLDRSVWLVSGVFILSLAVGLATGSRAKLFLERANAAATEEAELRYKDLRRQLMALQSEPAASGRGARRDPRAASTLSGRAGGRYAVMPPLPLAALSVGQSDLLPSAVLVSTEPREQVLSAAEIENPHRLLDGRFDVTFVLVYLYPLLILALSYNVISSEREQGTLSLLLSQPVALGRVVLAKIALRFLFFLGTILTVAIVGLMATGLSLLDPQVVPRLAIWVAAVALYGAFWFAVTLAIASRGHGSAATALGAAGTWLVLVSVVPALVNLAINAVYPMPSRVQMVQAMREASDDASAQGSVLLARYFEDHPELAVDVDNTDRAARDVVVTRVAVADEVQRLVRPVVEQYETQIDRQRAAADRLRYLSPALVVRAVLDDVSGTGAARHAWFIEQVDAYHASWREVFRPLLLTNGRVDRLEDVPHFTYLEEWSRDVAWRAAPGLLTLLALTGAFTWFSAMAIRRYSITE
jgi:ABC-2 type transport system permease protein